MRGRTKLENPLPKPLEIPERNFIEDRIQKMHPNMMRQMAR